MRVSAFSSLKTIVAALLALTLLATSLNSPPVSAQKENNVHLSVSPETAAALRGESYIVDVEVCSRKPANISLTFNIVEGTGIEVSPLNDTCNIVLMQDEFRTFKFNITIEQTAVGNITVSFILRSNITSIDLVKNHTVKVLFSRNLMFNLTKKLVNREINITVLCGDSKLFSVAGKVDENGLFSAKQEIPALSKICNLTVLLKTDLGFFLINETVGVELEKLLNATIYPGYLVNVTLNVLTLEGWNLESRNLFANIAVDNGSVFLNLSLDKAILLGPSENGEEKKVDLTIGIKTKNIYLLNTSQVRVKREDHSIGVYLNEKRLPEIREDLLLNITVPVADTKFNLFYLDKGGIAKPTSGVVRVVEIEVPLAYNSSTGLFDEGVKCGLEENVTIVRGFNDTAARVNVTMEFAGTLVACSVELINGSGFKCGDAESRLLLEGGDAKIVVNTTSSPIRGQIDFADLTQRVLYWGTIKIPGVPKNASGALKLGSHSLRFECVSRPADSGYLCEGRVFLWPLALLPSQPVRSVAGELQVDGEIYRLEMGLVGVYTGVWGFALAAIATIVAVVAILARRPITRPPREKLEIYDEHYDLG